MAGVVVVVSIPTAEHEDKLKQKSKKRVNISEPFKSKAVREPSPLQQDNDGNKSSPDGSERETPAIESITAEVLEKLCIENYSWIYKDGKYIQIMFPMESGARCEEVLEIFKENIVKHCRYSVVSVIPCSVYYQGCLNNEEDQEEDDWSTDSETDKEHAKTTTWARFLSSVSTRLSVAQVVETLKSEAALTFDFVSLVVIATILCAIGLVENSNITLLSSMLISPMMGPVMAGTFGSVIQDKKLQKMGVRNEMIGLGIAVVVGFCCGSVICFSTDRYGENDWPTAEMISRGEIRTLGVGCFIALLSGAAVALGILSDNFASLVGVAISTSLMPPAVNAGLLWSMTFVYYVKQNETSRYVTLSYTEHYSQNRGLELTSLGAVSLCLTFVNIIFIYVAGILVLKIKEVAPIASRDAARRQFWKHGIKITRDYNKTLHKDEAMNLHRQLFEELAALRSHKNPHNQPHRHNSTDLSTTTNTRINIKQSQLTWSPCTDFSKLDEAKMLYSRIMKEGATSSRILNFKPNVRNQRKLTQIFAPHSSDFYAKPAEDFLIPISEDAKKMNQSQSHESNINLARTRKFLVTPCTSDPLKFLTP